MNLKHVLFCAATAVCMCACVTFTHEADPGGTTSQGKAYVFGRFSLRIDKGTAYIALNLEGENGIKHFLPLKPQDDTYAIEIAPGTYRITSVYYLNNLQNTVAINSFKPDKKPFTSFRVQSRELFYIGDFDGAVQTNGSQLNFALEKIRDRYDETLNRMLEKNPAYDELAARSIFHKE